MDSANFKFGGVRLVGKMQQVQSAMKLSRVKSTKVCKVIDFMGVFSAESWVARSKMQPLSLASLNVGDWSDQLRLMC